MMLAIDVSVDDFVNGVEPSDAFELIKKLDLMIGDYDFTLDLARHFVSELIKEHEVVGEIFDVSLILPSKNKPKKRGKA